MISVHFRKFAAASMALIVASAAAILTSCSTTPTGRKQLNLVPDSQMDQLGAQSFQEMQKKQKLSSNSSYLKISSCVVNHLLQHNGFKPKEWELKVFADQSVNAFALPGKKIGIHEGLFKAAKNQHQLAAVIGHEIGHVVAEHGNERVSQQLLVQGGLTLADLAVDQQTTKGKTILMALGLGANFGVILPFSRKHELEADELGLIYMAKAGFTPDEAIQLWMNMSQQGGSPPEFISTHPDPKRRISDIRAKLAKVEPSYRQALSQGIAPNCNY